MRWSVISHEVVFVISQVVFVISHVVVFVISHEVVYHEVISYEVDLS